MTHRVKRVFVAIEKCPPDDTRLRAFATVVYGLLPTSLMVVNASSDPCHDNITIQEAMS